jgi:DNA-3-methyladenine glycosylase
MSAGQGRRGAAAQAAYNIPAAGAAAPAQRYSGARQARRDGTRLGAEFFGRPVLEVARDLIGCVVEHEGVSGAIVETEAYHQSEPACHAFAGLTPRTSTLFGEPGHAYVYRSYGIHALLNTVAESAGVGAGVLIRALQPLTGIELMRARRGVAREEDLCSGPGKLTQALGVPLSYNGVSLADGPIAIHAHARGPLALASAGPVVQIAGERVVSGTRIGITKAVDLRWRFCVAGNPHVSRPRPRA